MSSLLKFIALSLFAAVGLVVACYLATALPGVTQSAKDNSLASADTISLDVERGVPDQRYGHEEAPAWNPPGRAKVASSSSANAFAEDDLEPTAESQTASAVQYTEPIVSQPNRAVRENSNASATPVVVAPQPPFTQRPPGDMLDPAYLNNLIQMSQKVQQQESQRAADTNKQIEALLGQSLPSPAAPTPQLPAPADATPTNVAPRKPPSIRKATAPVIKSNDEGDDNLSIHIQDTDIREVLDLISEQGGLNILASNNVTGKVSAALNDVDIDTALAAILRSTGFVSRREGKFVYIGTPQDFIVMEQSSDKVSTRIYRPNYVKASDLQQLVTPLLTQGIGTVSVTAPSETGIAANTATVGGNSFAGGDTVLVRDYEAVLTQVDQVFDEIDKRPMQVAIEAMILSVRVSDTNKLGVDFSFLRNKDNIRFVTGAPAADLASMTFKDGGLKFGFLDSSLGAFITALETIGDTNVIATPRLMCLNKQRAEILIGSQLGYVNTTLTETSTAQNVQFLEVGTQLRLRPFISTDGTIRMEVHPELSTGSVEVKEGFTLPNKDTTQVTTNIMVNDGCTVIIGGLMREDLKSNSSQVPFLGSAPGIGFLFRTKTDTTEKHELIVLITPRIVYEPGTCIEGEKGACDFHRRQAVYADQMSPIGTRYLGRKYLRLAQNAWAAGNRPAAMRFVALAINFDPVNRAAIELRSDITAGNHFGQHSGPGTMAGAMPQPPIGPPAMVGDDGQTELMPQAPEHPLNPGQPGRVRNIDKPRKLQ